MAKNLLFVILTQDYSESLFNYFEAFLLRQEICLHLVEVKDGFTLEDSLTL
jgi:hypothetical protein